MSGEAPPLFKKIATFVLNKNIIDEMNIKNRTFIIT